MTSLGTIAALHRYPVKSMQGDRPDAVDLDETGIVGDRGWALRDVATDKLVSAKRPRLWRAMLDCHASGTGDDVTVTLPDGTSLGITDDDLPAALGALFDREVTVEAAAGPQQGLYASDWPEIEGVPLSGEMDVPTNLSGEGTTFIDVGLLHTLSTTAMDTLAAAAPDCTIHVDRFRPGIVFDTPGLEGIPDNDWAGTRLRIGDGGAVITIGEPAPRCIMTTVAQGDLPQEAEILRAIARENRLETPFGVMACLGSYATVTEPGTIRVGDTITVI